jgi:hypothetical protein
VRDAVWCVSWAPLIRQILTRDIAVGELRGMLTLRRAQIEQSLAAEQERLQRVEAHLWALEGSDTVEFRHRHQAK